MRRILTFALTTCLLLTLSIPAVGAEGETPDTSSFDPDDMVFPLGGDEYRITDSFGDCRDGCARSHEGVDIMAPKGTPVYAVADGVATWVSDSPDNCCRLGIDHGNGWYTRYLHLNDDKPDGSGGYVSNTDGQGWGIAEGIVDGAQITAGQLIGWVGDSGNAAEDVSHLHFELRQATVGGNHWDTTPIDAYPYLLRAEGNWIGQFYDDDTSVHQNNIERIFAAGITVGCNPPLNNEFCPLDSITRGQMAAFIARALNLTEMSGATTFDDVEGHQFAMAIDKLMTAGIGFGCDADSFCPNEPLLRDEMAEMLVRAFDFENPEKRDYFGDDSGNPYQASINKLAANGITVGCNPPDYDRYCPTRTLSRAEMATFFVRVGAA